MTGVGGLESGPEVDEEPPESRLPGSEISGVG